MRSIGRANCDCRRRARTSGSRQSRGEAQVSSASVEVLVVYPCRVASSSHSARVVKPCGDSVRPSVTGLRQNQRNTTPPSTVTALV